MVYRAMLLAATVAALGLAHGAQAVEPAKPPAALPAASDSGALSSSGESAARLRRGTAGLRLAADPAARPVPFPGAGGTAKASAAGEAPRYEFDRPAGMPPAMAPDDFRYGLSARAAPVSPLKLSRSYPATKTGWNWSGRVGPLRWMSPLDGEGESKLRFGGRVPGQPRMPGMGNFNVGIHYTFE
jgi:hypothetical protein